MKYKTVRFILALVSIWPALVLCTGFASFGLFKAIYDKQIVEILLCIPFLSCLCIYVIFIKDTLELK